IAHTRRVPSRTALAQRGGHSYAGFENEISSASSPGVHANSVVHCRGRQRLFDISLAGSAVPPPCAVGRLFGVNDKTERVIAHAEFLGGFFAWSLDEPADRILVIPAL